MYMFVQLEASFVGGSVLVFVHYFVYLFDFMLLTFSLFLSLSLSLSLSIYLSTYLSIYLSIYLDQGTLLYKSINAKKINSIINKRDRLDKTKPSQ